ncbi:hypothetical protein K402DRAFT_389334 [Aulographum hederae CBS 113979]|uniref:F-box domain-containing protein n=1 Tax=Aulographum hederae CBS 113979 TaxID=1176131 RepID=A0A6G1HDI9_9PEZI|nr:hypothetical protein K402DRAFT_389334 [Aulographum hederae CBS 113979]
MDLFIDGLVRNKRASALLKKVARHERQRNQAEQDGDSTTAASKPAPAGFLDLPAEIRNIIYDLLLVSPAEKQMITFQPPRLHRRVSATSPWPRLPPADISFILDTTVLHPWPRLPPADISFILDTTVLHLSRQIYQEASSMLYQNNTFRFHVGWALPTTVPLVQQPDAPDDDFTFVQLFAQPHRIATFTAASRRATRKMSRVEFVLEDISQRSLGPNEWADEGVVFWALTNALTSRFDGGGILKYLRVDGAAQTCWRMTAETVRCEMAAVERVMERSRATGRPIPEEVVAKRLVKICGVEEVVVTGFGEEFEEKLKKCLMSTERIDWETGEVQKWVGKKMLKRGLTRGLNWAAFRGMTAAMKVGLEGEMLMAVDAVGILVHKMKSRRRA